MVLLDENEENVQVAFKIMRHDFTSQNPKAERIVFGKYNSIKYELLLIAILSGKENGTKETESNVNSFLLTGFNAVQTDLGVVFKVKKTWILALLNFKAYYFYITFKIKK